MGFFDNKKAKAEAVREGRRKADRDIDLVNQFIDVHEGKPDYEVSRKFFSSLGDDVRPGPETETYQKAIAKHQQFVKESGFIQPQNIPPHKLPGGGFAIPIALDADGNPDFESLAPALAQILAQAMGVSLDPDKIAQDILDADPNFSERDVDRMAAEHGHDTREDECEGLVALRRKIAERDGK